MNNEKRKIEKKPIYKTKLKYGMNTLYIRRTCENASKSIIQYPKHQNY